MASLLLSRNGFIATALIAALAALYGPSVQRTATVVGLFRSAQSTHTGEADQVRFIDDAEYCEDLHLHRPSNTIFAACQGFDIKSKWFPPLGLHQDAHFAQKAMGAIHVIDPKVRQTCLWTTRHDRS
jgi:hypothetical protein